MKLVRLDAEDQNPAICAMEEEEEEQQQQQQMMVDVDPEATIQEKDDGAGESADPPKTEGEASLKLYTREEWAKELAKKNQPTEEEEQRTKDILRMRIEDYGTDDLEAIDDMIELHSAEQARRYAEELEKQKAERKLDHKEIQRVETILQKVESLTLQVRRVPTSYTDETFTKEFFVLDPWDDKDFRHRDPDEPSLDLYYKRLVPIVKLQDILLAFEMCSSLHVNYSKSAVYPICKLVKVQEAADALQCQVGYLLTQYLGLPLGAQCSRKEIWNPVVDKVQKRVGLWRNRTLSKSAHIPPNPYFWNRPPEEDEQYLSLYSMLCGLVKQDEQSYILQLKLPTADRLALFETAIQIAKEQNLTKLETDDVIECLEDVFREGDIIAEHKLNAEYDVYLLEGKYEKSSRSRFIPKDMTPVFTSGCFFRPMLQQEKFDKCMENRRHMNCGKEEHQKAIEALHAENLREDCRTRIRFIKLKRAWAKEHGIIS